jgi:hypothetical protein
MGFLRKLGRKIKKVFKKIGKVLKRGFGKVAKAFGLAASAQNFLWQELRDQADFNFRRWDNDEQRKASLLIAALGNETGASTESNWNTNLTAIKNLVDGWLD